MSQPETMYLQEEEVTVSNARAVIGGTTYALANISSVGVGKTEANTTPALLMVLLAAGSLMCAATTSGDFRLMAMVGVVLFGLLAFFMFRSAEPSYYVRIVGAGGEQRALTSSDKARIEKIVSALNQAIVSRG